MGEFKEIMYIKASKMELEYKQGKVELRYNGNQTTVHKETLVSFVLSVLEQVNPSRDYTSVTSVQKLLRILDIEMIPDDSDVEEEPKKTGRVVAKPVGKGRTQIVKKEESESESDVDSD